jgi:hypothetical protein
MIRNSSEGCKHFLAARAGPIGPCMLLSDFVIWAKVKLDIFEDGGSDAKRRPGSVGYPAELWSQQL